jgi:TfoX/Sxy family transcriptional regulator of competence genes
MAYNESLAQRIRDTLADLPGLVEKKMFGGVGFMVQGNMACGVNGDDLIVRVGPAQYEEALGTPHAKEFDLTGRPMRGWVAVSPEGTEADRELERWIQQDIDFARSLPPK